MRDRVVDSTIRIRFTTNDGDGAPVAPSSAFAASDFRIYKDGSATQKTSTNGITVTSPFDSVVGRHLIEIDTSNDTDDAGFWSLGSEYSVEVNSAKTVDGVSQTGVIVGEFRLVSGLVELDPASRVKLAAEQPDYDLPTNSELSAALAAADDAVLAAIAALNNLSAAQVNAELLDVLSVDTFGELSAPPSATSSLKDKLTWLFMWAKNKATETSTQRKLYADNSTTVVSTETVSDDGTTFSKTKAS